MIERKQFPLVVHRERIQLLKQIIFLCFGPLLFASVPLSDFPGGLVRLFAISTPEGLGYPGTGNVSLTDRKVLLMRAYLFSVLHEGSGDDP